MNQQLSYEADGFELETELDTELDELDELDESNGLSATPAGSPARRRSPAGRGCCCCRRRSAGAVGETDQESAPGLSVPPWINPLFRLYRAGRLGWKAGRFIDKASGQVLGKPISNIGADYLYKALGRSRKLEDFFDRLPPRVKRWLNQF